MYRVAFNGTIVSILKDGACVSWEEVECLLNRRGPERQPSGEMVMVLKSLAENRCHACGWPLAGSATDGCTPFNCSYRPNEQSAEHAAWLKKAHEMESVRAALSAAEASKEAK